MIEDIILPDGTPARRSTNTHDGLTRVSILTPMLMVRFLPNDDSEGGDHEMWPHWDEGRQQVVPNGFGDNIERGKDAGKPHYWQGERGQWCGRFTPVDHKFLLEHAVTEARRNLGDTPDPIINAVDTAESFLRDATSAFFVDDERLTAKELYQPLRRYNDRKSLARWAASVRRQKLKLAEARGGAFINKAEAIKIMERAEFKVEKCLDPWSGTEIPNSGGKKRGVAYFHDLMINYKGQWLRISRVDLANECPTRSYNIDGSNHPREGWINRVAYGVVVTDDDWWVVDATSDH